MHRIWSARGGYHAIPKLTFPGGALIGCSAGFLNSIKIKGSHTAMKSGMLAAEAAYAALTSTGLEAVAVAFILNGLEPWTLGNDKPDSAKTKPAKDFMPIDYPKPDGVLTFDLLSNLQRSGTNHADQPSHLRIKAGKEHVPSTESFPVFAGPEQRFCPAKVYEYTDGSEAGTAISIHGMQQTVVDTSRCVGANGVPQLVINAQNCVHCKCCSIKMPQEYINWTVPEGGGGPA
ncbi:hypothetical protein DYB31_013997 [Aphanomyces astaci]|uniref:Electron transfer flavoprotein-ubiquinone oxidoreductase n=1 Tax=Aphanomyces astaci TaxID=112090 RepID=A0A397FWR4_APHAT|nr:hypothetical protein DYB31_013997 [Aphanomyces astaci]